MASQAAAVLRIIERKRQEKQHANVLVKSRHIQHNTLHYCDQITQQV